MGRCEWAHRHPQEKKIKKFKKNVDKPFKVCYNKEKLRKGNRKVKGKKV
jgi:hypothetical protein